MPELRQLSTPMMGSRTGLHANQARFKACEELNNRAALQLSANDDLPVAEMACTWNTDLAMSNPIVVISSMDGSSHAVPNNTAIMAHRDAGGGAVHSIKSGHQHSGVLARMLWNELPSNLYGQVQREQLFDL